MNRKMSVSIKRQTEKKEIYCKIKKNTLKGERFSVSVIPSTSESSQYLYFLCKRYQPT